MKKPLHTFLRITLVLIMVMGVYGSVHALGDYTVLTPLPGTTKDGGNTTDFATYLPGLFNLSIGIAVALAFVMLSFGGFTYMTSDAIQGKADGRKYIEDALWGLILVIIAYALLYTINPQILEFDLNITRPKINYKTATVTTFENIPVGEEGVEPGGTVKSGYTLNEDQVKQNTLMVNDLQNNYGIKVNNGGTPCSTGQTKGCTNLVGLPDTAYRGIVDINNLCPDKCGIIISGGTEGGHSTHGPNLPVVDISENAKLTSYIQANGGTPRQTSLGPEYTMKINGQNVTLLYETSGGNHWHVVFPK